MKSTTAELDYGVSHEDEKKSDDCLLSETLKARHFNRHRNHVLLSFVDVDSGVIRYFNKEHDENDDWTLGHLCSHYPVSWLLSHSGHASGRQGARSL